MRDVSAALRRAITGGTQSAGGFRRWRGVAVAAAAAALFACAGPPPAPGELLLRHGTMSRTTRARGWRGKLAARTTIGQMNLTLSRLWLGVVVLLAVVGGSMPAWLR